MFRMVYYNVKGNWCLHNDLIIRSFHIVFAILEVLRYDFPGVYQSLVSSLEFYAYIQYPGYRWEAPNSFTTTSWILLLYVMFWQNQCCCEHLHDHQCGHWEIPGGLPASSLQTGSDPDLQVSLSSMSCMFIWIEKLYKRPSVKSIFVPVNKVFDTCKVSNQFLRQK